MIEEVAKSIRRGRAVDDAYLAKLQLDMISLYRLDQIQSDPSAREEFGPLPRESALLLGGLGLTWLCIGFFALRKKEKKGKNQ